MDASYNIRRAERADIPAIAEIEACSFTDAWPASVLADVFGPLCWVAESSGDLLGYLFARLGHGRAEILNVAVAPESRRDMGREEMG